MTTAMSAPLKYRLGIGQKPYGESIFVQLTCAKTGGLLMDLSQYSRLDMSSAVLPFTVHRHAPVSTAEILHV